MASHHALSYRISHSKGKSQPAPWVGKGSDYMTTHIQNAYNEWSDSYDSDINLTRDLDSKLTRELLAGLQADSILELGCGTGKNSSFLAQIGAKVEAVDFSQGMI